MTPTSPSWLTLEIDTLPFRLNQAEFIDAFAEVIAAAAAHVGLSDGALEHVVIADEARFGPAIHRVQASAGRPLSYTATDTFHAVAKSIPGTLGAGGGTASTVIVRDFVAALALADVHEFELPENIAPDAPRNFYILAHELGHCQDWHIRGATESAPLEWKDGRIISPATRYYGRMVLSEFAACVHSAQGMQGQVHDADLDEWHVEAARVMEAIGPALAAYQLSPDAPGRLFELAAAAAQSVWLLCVQYAKLVGVAVGNPRLRELPPRVGASDTVLRPNDMLGALAELERELRLLWACYPAWDSSSVEAIRPAWHALALAHGYRFDEAPSGDAMYLS